jgi:hypothetical protein
MNFNSNKQFNPYDLNDVANIDKFIQKQKERDIQAIINKDRSNNKKPSLFIKKA